MLYTYVFQNLAKFDKKMPGLDNFLAYRTPKKSKVAPRILESKSFKIQSTKNKEALLIDKTRLEGLE